MTKVKVTCSAVILRLLPVWLGISVACGSRTTTVPGHAHNDYENARPLYDAIDNGMLSVEADIHLIDGQLYVTHDRPQNLKDVPTLEALYLAPLMAHVERNHGIYDGYDGPFFLMIDVKTEAVDTYEQLKKVLTPYRSMLSYVKDGVHHKQPVDVVISGNRALDLMMAETNRYTFYDGRLSDLGRGMPVTLMPIVSDNFKNHFQFSGRVDMSAKERLKLREMVDEVHKEGKVLRFWATPDRPNAWRALLDAGVDLINTDKLEEFRNFYQQ